MMKNLLWVLLLLGYLSAWGETRAFRSASSFTNIPGWVYSIGQDTPYGSWFSNPGVSTNRVGIDVHLGKEMPPGLYGIAINTIDYETYWSTIFSADGGTSTNFTSDRDYNGRWSSFSLLNASSSFTNLTTWFTNGTAGAANKTAVLGVFLTDITNSIMLNGGRYIDFSYPSTNSWDNTSNGRNLIRNGSFETGIPHTMGFYAIERDRTVTDAWDSTVAWDGASSLRLVLTNGQPIQLIVKPLVCESNRVYVTSIRGKSTGTATFSIGVKSAITTPGSSFSNTLNTLSSFTLTTNWGFFAATNRILDFPEPEVNITLTVTGAGGTTTTNWLDAFMMTDATATNYVAEAPLEITAWMPGRRSAILHPDQSLAVPVRLHNSSTGSLTGQVITRVYDWRANEVLRVTNAYSLASRETNSVSVTLPSLIGRYRVISYDTVHGGEPDEAAITVAPRAKAIAAADSKFGFHALSADWVWDTATNLGIRSVRYMSPGAFARWGIAEPTRGNFVWFDNSLNSSKNAGFPHLLCVMADVAPWAERTYFPITNITGVFQAGEMIVASSGATGQVAKINTSTNFTGTALFLTNRGGTFAAGNTFTGQTSLAVGTVRSNQATRTVAMDLFPGFLTNLFNHYGTNLMDWLEIDNEPNQDTMFMYNGSHELYSDYARDVINVAKGYNPAVKISLLGGAFATNWAGAVWNNMASVGLTSYVHSLGFHVYPGGDSAVEGIQQFANGVGKPWLNTETGAQDFGAYASWSSPERREGRSVQPYSFAERYYRGFGHTTAMVIRNHIWSIGHGADKVFTYDFRSYAANLFDSEFGGLEHDDTLRTWPVAMSALAALVDGSTSLGPCVTNTGYRGFTFNDQNTNTVVALFCLNHTNVSHVGMPGGFPNYIRRDMMGNPVGTNESSFVLTAYPTYLTLTNAAASVHTNMAAATITLTNDVVAPVPHIILWPVVPARTNEQALLLRWFATDNNKPETGVFANDLLYSTRLTPRDSVFSAFEPDVFTDIAGLSPGAYTFEVIAKDVAGNTNYTSESFWIGTPYYPPRATANTLRAVNFNVK